MLYQRFLSSTSNQDKPPLSNNNNSVKDDPAQAKESGGEKEQKSDAGKSIRGSVCLRNYWLQCSSFSLSIVLM
jgi:hypothetical protein